ncbi:hypothetical protein DBB36_12635 [Flavobacterium sp. WLB]|uniref:hypothetical protein n=1 Tax=unclassified Flavobacterium TaxID=196869 RepID=UPI0006ABEDB2|nr:MULTISPECIES: hypothetical protein [unclassified Flavobacterium]KOP35778.1 hypothetical protein AKO67_23655 [Flavobacterium sp. VMW]OWU92092.1 hypothetical protein APR43_02335 [Flavobacterium sp. NLM]PUU69673.1 hypothetical protein DBB36_12635 [Flavobacterium sp. WLB]
MNKALKQYLVKSFIILAVIHLAYFLYGYFTFEGIKKIDIYSEFYRFKFYDDVSISHFFISGLFLLFFLIFLLKNHARQHYSFGKILKIGFFLLLISFVSLTFFISFSFGQNVKLKGELSEKSYNKDKELLNVLNPFLYNSSSYYSEKLFNYENILYPKPYPVIKEERQELIYHDQFGTVTTYYSIDTLKVLTETYNKVSKKADSIFDFVGLDVNIVKDRIIKQTVIGDSTQIVFKGTEVSPEYDKDICIFIENKSLYKPVNGEPIDKQQYEAAVKRYKLLYKFKQDSLTKQFQKLDTLFKKYNIETHIVPKKLTSQVFYYTKNQERRLEGIENYFDRKALNEKFQTLERYFYQPNYLHPNILPIFFIVVAIVWLGLFLFYIPFNYMKGKKL